MMAVKAGGPKAVRGLRRRKRWRNRGRWREATVKVVAKAAEGCGEGGEDDPTIPILETAAGTFGPAEYSFLFDMVDLSFRGTVFNPTAETICGSKTEIHMGMGGTSVVELGPTMPVDVLPGETVQVVMTAPAYMPDTYAVHPEHSQCP